MGGERERKVEEREGGGRVRGGGKERWGGIVFTRLHNYLSAFLSVVQINLQPSVVNTHSHTHTVRTPPGMGWYAACISIITQTIATLMW